MKSEIDKHKALFIKVRIEEIRKADPLLSFREAWDKVAKEHPDWMESESGCVRVMERRPQIGHRGKRPFDSPGWIFEIKLDGYRAITAIDAAGKPHLWSRNGLAIEAKFPAIATAVSKAKAALNDSRW